MCGRYRLARKQEILVELFDARNDAEWTPGYNAATGQDVPVIRQDATQPVQSISPVPSGLAPSWAKECKAGYMMINGSAERVANKPASSGERSSVG
jgi:putative SOS response-associated peptidase YedK